MQEFAFEDDEPPARSYSSRRKGNGNAVIWLVALALILVPTALFVAIMGAAHEKRKAAAVEAVEENVAIMKKYPDARNVSAADERAFEKNVAIIKSAEMSFVEFVAVANLVYLLLFIPYILIVLITAFCLSQATKG